MRTCIRGRTRTRVVGLLAAGVLLAGAGCTGQGGGGGGGGGAGGSTTTTTAPPPEEFDGPVEEFYRVPDPLPPGEPGQLIRIQEVAASAATTTVRVMYHSRDARDQDRAVTGIVTHPSGPAPDGGWPVVSWSHGTAGLASQCAPSRNGYAAPAFGVEGVAVATDYVGLGPIGELHPYLSKPSEGNAAIDAVRAARNLAGANAGPRWLSVGHSQGGHGALSAAELSPSYAPELDLLGTVAFAPASDFELRFGGIDEIVSRVVGAMALYGAESEHPEIDAADYAGPELEAVADVIRTECLDAIIGAVALLPPDTFYDNDPVQTEPARSIVLANEVGTERVDAPLLLVSGTLDDRVVIDRVRALYGRLCEIEQVTELVVVEGAGHGDVIPRTSAQVEAWLGDRLAGAPATDTCGT